MKWFKGDLHAHSIYSDGKEDLDAIFSKVRDHGLQFFALTEHRSIEPLKHLPDNPGTLVIPGFEFGSKLGHANIFGLTSLLTENHSLEKNQVIESLREARASGGSIAVNHPFHYESTWLVPLEETIFDWIEVWNGPWFNSNQGCLDWWQQQLCAGKKIPVAGGSDCHSNLPFHYFGQPTTWTMSKALDVESILEALRGGRTVLSYSPDGPFAEISCDETTVGGTVFDGPRKGRLEVTGLVKGDRILLITDRGVENEIKEGFDDEYSADFAFPGRMFVRVEIHRYFNELMSYQMAGMTNPIYFN